MIMTVSINWTRIPAISIPSSDIHTLLKMRVILLELYSKQSKLSDTIKFLQCDSEAINLLA